MKFCPQKHPELIAVLLHVIIFHYKYFVITVIAYNPESLLQFNNWLFPVNTEAIRSFACILAELIFFVKYKIPYWYININV